ncbi:MAG: gamma carbonic anhydrase family protein [Alphaproteobacteria bacterium]|nr:gamma carbonic anhydrase family protein [Alphaproteobacteria bacterium]|tara:strand:- start:702 stop:1289 length:588 start_codon:yes stop_codon:yes gene_type:complete
MNDYSSLVTLNEPAFIHPTTLIYGKVTIGPGSSMWANTVIRAENDEVVVGANTNIQDFTMIHVGSSTPSIIGDNCSVTHHCTVHGCVIEDNCLIGINATIMDGAIVGANTIVAGGAFVTEGTIIPENSIVAGVPAKVIKTRNNRDANCYNAILYNLNAEAYARGEHRAWDDTETNAEAKRRLESFRAAHGPTEQP